MSDDSLFRIKIFHCRHINRDAILVERLYTTGRTGIASGSKIVHKPFAKDIYFHRNTYSRPQISQYED